MQSSASKMRRHITVKDIGRYFVLDSAVCHNHNQIEYISIIRLFPNGYKDVFPDFMSNNTEQCLN
jgi:hypothetical protein